MFNVNQAVKVKEGDFAGAVGIINSIDAKTETLKLSIKGVVNGEKVDSVQDFAFDDLEAV